MMTQPEFGITEECVIYEVGCEQKCVIGSAQVYSNDVRLLDISTWFQQMLSNLVNLLVTQEFTSTNSNFSFFFIKILC